MILESVFEQNLIKNIQYALPHKHALWALSFDISLVNIQTNKIILGDLVIGKLDVDFL